MSGDAAQRGGILVVYATENLAIDCRDLGWRDAGGRSRRQEFELDSGAQRPFSPRIEEEVEPRAARVLEQEAEQHESRIAVERLPAGLVSERLDGDRQLERGAAGHRLEVLPMRG